MFYFLTMSHQKSLEVLQHDKTIHRFIKFYCLDIIYHYKPNHKVMKFNSLVQNRTICWDLKPLLLMKLTIFLIIVSFFQSIAHTNAQKITLNFKNVALEKVINQIRIQSKYDFVFHSSDIKQASPVTIVVKDASLEDALNMALANQSLSYIIKDKAVVIKKQVQSDIEVTGVVTDESNTILSGVTVKVVGYTQSTSTNADGRFTLKNVNKNALIQFSFLGFDIVERKAQTNMGSIRLKASSADLDEVVVIGYGSVRRQDVTGSISSLKPNEMDASKSLSVDNLIQGKIAGVAVSGGVAQPGAAPNIIIRGANSLRGDNQPLYIIDNIPQPATGTFAASSIGSGDFEIPQNPLTSISPNDIEDIQILKDASATAIYGSRGANGVIIITTKKGKAGTPKVNFSTNGTIVGSTRLRKMMNLSEYADYRNERAGSTPMFFKVGDEIRYTFDGNAYDPNVDSTYIIATERNWQKEIYGNPLSQAYNLSVSGGNDKVKYYLATDYKDIKGLVKETNFKQGGLRLNLGGSLSQKLTFNTSLAAVLKKNNMMAGANTKGGVTSGLTRSAIDSAPFLLPPDDPSLESNEELRTTALSWLTDYEDVTSEKTIMASADLTWKFARNFSYTLRGGGNIGLQERTRWFDTGVFLGLNNNGYLGNNNFNRNNLTIENLVNYNARIGNIANVSATAGVTFDDYNVLNRSILASDFEFKDLGIDGLHMANNQTINSPQQSDYQLLSYLARVNFSFLDGKYIVTATGRADGSSKFNADNRWAFFPSTAIAWKLDKENFLESQDWIDELKIRLGYGKTGSQSISPYNTFYNYEQSRYYSNGSGELIKAIVVSNLSNPNLKWETTSSYNAGLDFNMWKGRLSGTFEIYSKETTDLLVNKNIATSTGFQVITVNQGALSNKGLELSLSSDIIRNDNFSWNLSGNIGTNTRRVLDLGSPMMDLGVVQGKGYLGNSIGDHFGVANIFLVDKAPGLFYGFQTDGIIQSGETNLPTSTIFNQLPGEIKVVDLNGDGVINANDMTIIGDPNPDFNYGFQTTLGYKRFKFSTSFYGVHGGEILNANIRYEQTPANNTSNTTSYAYANAWRADRPSNLFPSVHSNVKNYVNDRYVEDGSFLRCGDITLSYLIPKDALKGKAQNINVFGSVKNAFIITNYSGYDPEMRTFSFDGLRPGIDIGSFSNPRQFVVGLNVTF